MLVPPALDLPRGLGKPLHRARDRVGEVKREDHRHPERDREGVEDAEAHVAHRLPDVAAVGAEHERAEHPLEALHGNRRDQHHVAAFVEADAGPRLAAERGRGFRVVGGALDRAFGVIVRAVAGGQEAEHPFIGRDGETVGEAFLAGRRQRLLLHRGARAHHVAAVDDQRAAGAEQPRPRPCGPHQPAQHRPRRGREQRPVAAGRFPRRALAERAGEYLRLGVQRGELSLDQPVLVPVEIEQPGDERPEGQDVDRQHAPREGRDHRSIPGRRYAAPAVGDRRGPAAQSSLYR